MKIKTVESLLKQTKFITLYDDDRCQWVSNGHACYPLIWEIYGEIYAARMLGFLFKEQYDKLWHRLYPYITRVQLVPEGRIDDE